VVVVLALLAVVMLPALARSSDNGSRSVCINNLRQLGRAVAMYANDNADYLAYPNWGAPNMPNGVPGPGWLYTPVGGNPPNLSVAPYSSNPTLAYATGLLYQYDRSPSLYICPVDRESKYFPLRLNKLSSYIMNGAACGYANTYRSCKITEVWSPACYLSWNPDESHQTDLQGGLGSPVGAFAFNDASSYPDKNEGVATLHTLTGADILTVAGNVQFVSIQKFTAEQTSATKSLVWWSPFSANGK
jgi:hypothetical protein